ncbi:hypothetical protein AgCh_034539 [Apium graveolens]
MTPVEYKNRFPKAHTKVNLASPTRTPVEYRRRPSIIRHTPGGLQVFHGHPPPRTSPSLTDSRREFFKEYLQQIHEDKPNYPNEFKSMHLLSRKHVTQGVQNKAPTTVREEQGYGDTLCTKGWGISAVVEGAS